MRLSRYAAVGYLIALAASSGGYGTTLILCEEASVKGPRILLGDVARIDGENQSALAPVDLGPAAAPGASRQVKASMIPSRIKVAGIDPRSVEITGGPVLRVTTRSRRVTQAMVVESLREYLASRTGGLDGRRIDIQANFEEVVLPDGELAFHWRHDLDYAYTGPAVFCGNIVVDGRNRRALTCRVDIQPLAPAVAAARNLGPGSALAHPRAASRKLVARNQMVTVETNAGDLIVSTQAKAASDGVEGDVIECVNESSGVSFQGIVRKDGVIVVK